MLQLTWMRRLDDRVDRMVRRRFGVRLLSGPELTPRRQLLLVLGTVVTVVAVLALALVASSQAGRVPGLAGPVVGAVAGTTLGWAVRAARKRRQQEPVRAGAAAADSGHDRRR